MCLQVPLQVKKIKAKTVVVETGKELICELKQTVRPGDYVYGVGNLVVGTIPAMKAKEIRRALHKEVHRHEKNQ